MNHLQKQMGVNRAYERGGGSADTSVRSPKNQEGPHT